MSSAPAGPARADLTEPLSDAGAYADPGEHMTSADQTTARKTGQLVRKMLPLPGVLRAEWVRCGKPSCRCVRGERHGPYLFRRWRQNGRQRRQYVKPSEAEQVAEALAAWRRLHPPARSMRSLLADVNRLARHLPTEEV
jgi:hypothetical protein